MFHCELVFFFCSSVTSGDPTWQTDATYAYIISTLEGVYSQYWPQWEDAVRTAVEQYNINFCDDCFTALQHMVCSTLVPRCGFLNCFSAAAQQTAQCTQSCLDVCGTGSTTVSTECYDCVLGCYSEVLYGSCSYYMMGRSMCEEFVNVCGCNPPQTVVDAVCTWFAADGYHIPFPTGLTCTDEVGWCSDVSYGRALNAYLRQDDSSASCLQPNEHVCMAAPQSVGSNQAGNPAQVNESPEPNTSGSAALIASVGVVALAIFA